jgi:anti-sigma regulatory factor (Ser/Thr protein kinase)
MVEEFPRFGGSLVGADATTQLLSGFMSGPVVFSVPAALAYRELICGAVAAVCRVLGRRARGHGVQELERFTNELVSAVGEAFNNSVIHAYAERDPGFVELELSWTADEVTVELRDTGRALDLDSVPPPDLSMPHERGMGIYIIKSLVDHVCYAAGTPNVLTLTKHAHTVLGLPSDPGPRPLERRG